MATTPPTELPPPNQPGQPEAPPPEISPNAPDVDIPSPDSNPGDEPFQPTD